MKNHPTVTEIAPPLLEWYGKNARDLPWRQNHDPYRVWVSEIMLQQTRVEAVKPYYQHFLQRLPTIAHLAQVPEEELMKLWEGLGYYSRVRNMQKAAKLVVEQYGGQMPATPEELKKLPGIGDYTAGAVASIAFGYPAACVDGNVLRVFARLRADREDIASPKVREALSHEISANMPQNPGDFNQALMELGATVCLPNGEPLCQSCPLGHLCLARQQGIQNELPVKAAKPARTVSRRHILVLRDSTGRIALRKRAQGPLKGMWELPGLEGELTPQQVEAGAAELGFDAKLVENLGPSKHIFTHREWQMTGWLLQSHCPFEAAERWVFATAQELERDYALPAAFRAYRVWKED